VDVHVLVHQRSNGLEENLSKKDKVKEITEKHKRDSPHKPDGGPGLGGRCSQVEIASRRGDTDPTRKKKFGIVCKEKTRKRGEKDDSKSVGRFSPWSSLFFSQSSTPFLSLRKLSRQSEPMAQQQTLQLFLSCRDLPATDRFSETDPMCEVYLVERSGKTSTQRLVGRTEKIRNNPNPRFMTPVAVDFYFEQQQTLLVRVVDWDDDGSTTPVADATVSLGRLFGDKPVTVPLASRVPMSRRIPTLTVQCAPLTQDKAFALTMDVSLQSKSKPWWIVGKVKDWMFPSKVHLRVLYHDTNLPLGCRTQDISWSTTTGMHWPDWKITYRAPDKDTDVALRFEVVSIVDCKSDMGQREQVVASFVKHTQSLCNATAIVAYQDNYEVTLEFKTFRSVHSLLDYMARGMRVHVGMAIDFTGSNGHPTDAGSLHYLPPGKGWNEVQAGNAYFSAIQSVGHVLEQYSGNSLMQAIGFGAYPPEYPTGGPTGAGKVTVKFPGPLQTTEDMLLAYVRLTPTLTFSGPTWFAPVLEWCMDYVDRNLVFSHDHQDYMVLCIVTDGTINDMEATCDCICEAAKRPMSIVIVGVGENDFENMNILDGDDESEGGKGRLHNSAGIPCVRDIVQFIDMKTVQGDMLRMRTEVLKEIPRQVMEYAQHENIGPGRTLVRDVSDLERGDVKKAYPTLAPFMHHELPGASWQEGEGQPTQRHSASFVPETPTAPPAYTESEGSVKPNNKSY
jgi:hypothetical protein